MSARIWKVTSKTFFGTNFVGQKKFVQKNKALFLINVMHKELLRLLKQLNDSDCDAMSPHKLKVIGLAFVKFYMKSACFPYCLLLKCYLEDSTKFSTHTPKNPSQQEVNTLEYFRQLYIS
jgi:hypothetical protein